MTVSELIEKLREAPQDYEVKVLHFQRFCDDPVDIDLELADLLKIDHADKSVRLLSE